MIHLLLTHHIRNSITKLTLNKGMARHMESFGHTWYEISKVKCSAWGCEKKFQNFQEYWQHRYSTHGDGLYNINNGNKGKKFMTDYRWLPTTFYLLDTMLCTALHTRQNIAKILSSQQLFSNFSCIFLNPKTIFQFRL